MSRASIRIWSPVLALLLGAAVVTTALVAAPAPTKEQIARWVAQLGDNDFAVREAATKKLWEAGQPAEAALLIAAERNSRRRLMYLRRTSTSASLPRIPRGAANESTSTVSKASGAAQSQAVPPPTMALFPSAANRSRLKRIASYIGGYGI